MKINPGEREELFERVAAARTVIDRTGLSGRAAEDAELAAFMAIFHPEKSSDVTRDLILARRQAGQAIVESALALSAISLVLIGALTALGMSVADILNQMASVV